MDFPTTHWSQLALATLHGGSDASAALGEFYRRYREPVRFFILRRGAAPDRAEDLTHDFFVHLMEKSTLGRADATRGKFRTFLLGSLVRFLGDVHDRANAAKRGHGATPLSLDAEANAWAEPTVPAAAAAEFDREWALSVLALALQRLEQDHADRGEAAKFAALRDYLPGVAASPPYDETAAHLGISLAAFKSEVHRLRQRFRAGIRVELARTVSSPMEIDTELAYLGQVLRSAAAAPRLDYAG
jgi:DNA-directed RNA polymerase specialized sigma24 family protein